MSHESTLAETASIPGWPSPMSHPLSGNRDPKNGETRTKRASPAKYLGASMSALDSRCPGL